MALIIKRKQDSEFNQSPVCIFAIRSIHPAQSLHGFNHPHSHTTSIRELCSGLLILFVQQSFRARERSTATITHPKARTAGQSPSSHTRRFFLISYRRNRSRFLLHDWRFSGVLPLFGKAAITILTQCQRAVLLQKLITGNRNWYLPKQTNTFISELKIKPPSG